MFSFRSSFFSLLLLGAAPAAVSINAQEGLRLLESSSSCDLECPSNAPCRFGKADFSERTGLIGEETHRNGMHCDCPIGWTGILCDKKYETCTNQQGHECYNGGECILGVDDKYGNEQLVCDCSKARGFVGKYCETPFAQWCGEDEVACVNGSACNPSYPTSSSDPCICDDGFEGRHCQSKKDDSPPCTLDCQNGGFCFFGNDNNMVCECPPGFDGPLCGLSGDRCGKNSDHVCLNGGKCVTTNVEDASNGMIKTRHHCDCTSATYENNQYFAGKYCEQKATSFCSNSEDGNNFFCTQGGTCKSNPMDGCSCPDGTAGFKCEFIVEPSGPNNKGYSLSTSNQEANPPCDGGYCLNGGNCIQEQIVVQDGTGTSTIDEYCDCSQTYDGDSYYAGVYCQYKSTSVCLVENSLQQSSDSAFCVHNGDCKQDGSCDCPHGWTGEHCELKTLDPDQVPVGEDGFYPDEQFKLTTVDKCGDSVCYNGGSCVETQRSESDGDIRIESYCDCSTAFDEKYLYAGTSCEFPHTEVCWIPRESQDFSEAIFCTNHGSCRSSPELGCDCPHGFSGPSCEYEDHDKACGSRICHNGGTCVTTTIHNKETGTSKTIYGCDCASAYDEETAYLGKSCEYPITSWCSAPGEPLSSALFCANHGICTQDPSKPCDCGDGFKGSFCEVKADFNDKIGIDRDDKGQEFELCGDGDGLVFPCFNGGECVTTTTTDENGKTFEASKCDCGPASNGFDIFAGLSCEYKATSHCKDSFCVNGGTCDERGVCDCPVPWKGAHCEYPMDEKELLPSSNQDEFMIDRANGGNSDIECNLDCMNGGVCVQGAKDLGVFKEKIKNIAHLNQTYADDQFAHCACPPGWTGLTCENKYEICGNNQHFCLHGSKCIFDTSTDQGYSCDCSQANDSIGNDRKTHMFSGDSCQYVDMDICSIGDEYLGRPLYFCVHGGRCKSKVTAEMPDPGCDCPDGFTGLSCEVKVAIDAKQLVMITGVLLVLISVLALVANYIRSLLLNGRKDGTVATTTIEDNGVPVTTRTTFSPRRRRKAGFGKSARKKSPPVSGTDEPSSSMDSAGDIDQNDGVMKDCCLDDEESPYDKNQDVVEFSTPDDDDVSRALASRFV